MEKKTLGLYIHIPFCARKCEYCDFISYENKEKEIEEYIKCLKKEIRIVSKEKSEKYVVNTVYIGGGTPSFINASYIEDIITVVKENWNISMKCEITIEINPGTVDESKLDTYYKIGINRISIGMQSNDNEILKIIGRIHTREEFLKTYNLARKIGFKNINVDIMIGLPTQTNASAQESIDEVIKLEPEHISMYSLILEEGTKLEERVTNKELFLPTEDEERKQYWRAKTKLEENGYIHYEISNFSKKGCESNHNLNCWKQNEYIGFGLSSHSYIDNKRYSNTEDLSKYILNVTEEKFEREMHEVQTEYTKQKEYMLLGLRMIKGVTVSDFKNRFIDNPIYVYRNELQKLTIQKLIEIDVDSIRLTDRGIDLANQVWEEFV